MSNVPDRVREVMAAVQNVHVLATVDEQNRPQMRWMGTVVECPKHPWMFYLACGKNSRKMAQIAQNPSAQLLFSKPDYSECATLSGVAEAVDTPEIRQLLWEKIPQMENYYSSADDPNMGIIRFTTKCLELLCMSEQHEPYCFEVE